jgi:hypothetical protein
MKSTNGFRETNATQSPNKSTYKTPSKKALLDSRTDFGTLN